MKTRKEKHTLRLRLKKLRKWQETCLDLDELLNEEIDKVAQLLSDNEK